MTSRTSCVTMLLCLVTAACNASTSSYASLDASEVAGQGAAHVATLPLQRGYYVASDTPCAQASNATLLLLRRNGIGGARYFCEFRHIREDGPATYLVEETCADFDGSDTETRHLQYIIASDVRFQVKDGNSTVLDARYCSQSELPPDWSTTDISSEIE